MEKRPREGKGSEKMEVDTIWFRDIEYEMLQVSIEMSKLRGLSGVNNILPPAAPCLYTAPRVEDRQIKSRCRFLLEANYELCKPLDLPFYKGQVKAIQTETSHQSCNAENMIPIVQLKPVLSKSQHSKIAALSFEVKAPVKKETTKKSGALTQRKKFAECTNRGDSTSTRKEIAENVVQHKVLPKDHRATELPSRNNDGPIYKVLAVSSHCQIQREKRFPKVTVNVNDSSYSALQTVMANSENSKK